MKASAAKEFVVRKKACGNRESSQAQEHQLEVIAMTNKLDTLQVEAKAMASRALSLPTLLHQAKGKEPTGIGSSAKGVD